LNGSGIASGARSEDEVQVKGSDCGLGYGREIELEIATGIATANGRASSARI
jgi:hypothetical protein